MIDPIALTEMTRKFTSSIRINFLRNTEETIFYCDGVPSQNGLNNSEFYPIGTRIDSLHAFLSLD